MRLESNTMSLLRKIQKKENEIEKRKEMIQQLPLNQAILQKQQHRDNSINNKVDNIKKTTDAKIQYFRKEIESKESKLQQDIRDLQDRFDSYKQYCLNQIENIESKQVYEINKLESMKDAPIVSLSDDKLLQRLEIELKQLEEQYNEENNRLIKERQQEHENRVKDEKERQYNEQMKQRRDELWKQEKARQEKQEAEERQKRKDEEARQERQEKIQQLMKMHGCDLETATQMYMYNLTRESAQVYVKQDMSHAEIYSKAKEIRLKYPDYKNIVSELDKEYTAKLARLSEDQVVSFLEKMKPLIEAKLEYEEDETNMDESHQEMYDDLTLDQKLQCVAFKTKEKRYKFLEKNKKLKSDRVNAAFHCV